jgi:hypothetical protein
MATTYGERLLADAEDRVRTQRQRRRLFVLAGPGLAILALATWSTLTARNPTLQEGGFFALLLDHVFTLAYAAGLVGFPLWVSLGRQLNATAAAIAAVAGPILMPVVRGPGWSLWQRAAFLLVCLLVIAARRSQPLQPRTRPRRRGRRR